MKTERRRGEREGPEGGMEGERRKRTGRGGGS